MVAQTSQNVANEALALIGYDGFPISAPGPDFDTSVPGAIAHRVYPFAVAACARLTAWSYARTVSSLTLTGNVAKFPWAFEYAFPDNCIDVWQLCPDTLVDQNNPVPIAWARGVNLVASVQASVIWTNINPARAIFNGNPLEPTWDPLFREAVVSYLAAEFAMANLGKPDMAEFYMDKWQKLIPAATARTDQ